MSARYHRYEQWNKSKFHQCNISFSNIRIFNTKLIPPHVYLSHILIGCQDDLVDGWGRDLQTFLERYGHHCRLQHRPVSDKALNLFYCSRSLKMAPLQTCYPFPDSSIVCVLSVVFWVLLVIFFCLMVI